MSVPANMTIIYDNPVDDAVSIVASSEVPTMPAAMLRTQQRSEIFRTMGCADEWIKIGFSRLVQPNILSFVNHNLSDDAQILLRLSDADDFDDSNVLIDEEYAFVEPLYGAGEQPFGFYGFGGAAVDSRNLLATRTIDPPLSVFFNQQDTVAMWAMINILDPLNADGFLKFGRIYCAQALTFSRNYSWRSTLKCVDPSIITTTPDQHIWPDKHAKIFERTINIGKLPSYERFYQLMDLWLTVGCTDQFIVILDPSTAESRRLTSHYCRLAEDPQIEDAFLNLHDVQLKIVEVR